MSFLTDRRKSRETIGTASVLALVLSSLVVATTAAPASAADSDIVVSTDFEDASWEDAWQSSGDPTVAVVDDDGNQVLQVAGRAADYEGIESRPATVPFEHGVVYTLTARAKLAEEAGGPLDMRAVRKVETPDGPDEHSYQWVGNTSVGTDWTDIVGTFTLPAGSTASSAVVYFGSDDNGDGTPYTYYLDDIVITKPEGSGGAPVGPIEIFRQNFEQDYVPFFANNASATLVADDASDGEQAVLVTGRSAGWHGLYLNLLDDVELEPGTYQISAMVKLAAGGPASTGLHLTVNQEPYADGSDRYKTVGQYQAPVGPDEWVEIGGEYILTDDRTSAQLYFDVQEQAGEHASFLVDDFVIIGEGELPPPDYEEYEGSWDFETGTLEGWQVRTGSATSEPTATIQDDEARDSIYAALISNRTSQGDGLGFDMREHFVVGQVYEVSAWVKMAEGGAADNITLSVQRGAGTFDNVRTVSGVTSTQWTELTTSYTYPGGDLALLYFETNYSTGGHGDFLVDDITVRSVPPLDVQDLPSIYEEFEGQFPVGVAIDSRETLGSPGSLTLRHFNQITAENHMKVEAWYDGQTFRLHPEARTMMDFAKANDLGVYGHVLAWHSQTPAWFFQDEAGDPLTTSETDKQFLRDRLRTHIFNVAEALSEWGTYGDDNPMIAWDVVNEVVADSAEFADGLRRSEWYRILGHEYIDLAFEYADEAFNQGEWAAPDGDRVELFINDYNTEQGGKQNRYRALVERMLADGVPLDGVGHQFHVNLSMPPSALNAAIERFADLPVTQAVTEMDVTIGTPVTEANLIEQGYYYEEAFDYFRDHADELYSVTIWGLTDNRSWRSAQAPLVFDGELQAKAAYYGIMGAELSPRLRAANVFQGTVALTADATSDLAWSQLRLHQVSPDAAFQLRWAPDHLTVFAQVTDGTADATDGVELLLEGETYRIARDGSGDVPAVVTNGVGGYSLVAHLPLVGAQGTSAEFDIRFTDGAETTAWNNPGSTGSLALIEALSYVEVAQTDVSPVIDAEVDAAWDQAASVQTTKQIDGSDGAYADVRTLWRDNTLYVLAEVTDPHVDVSGSDPWVQDSVEIYVDAGNFKEGAYRYDDTQIRISAENAVSFGNGDETFQANRVQSAAQVTDTGYVVEAAISLLEEGGLGTFHGLDFQVNDATDGARTSIRNWADPSGIGYQSTARWGVGQLVEEIAGPVAVVPQVTKHPVSQSVVLGGSAVLSAAASGVPAPTVQWQTRARVGGAWANIAGATSASLTVKPTLATDGHAYRAVFTNTVGKAESNAATVSVAKAVPKVTLQPKNVQAKHGKVVTLRAAASGQPAPKVQWQKRAAGKTKWTAIKGATSTSLKVKNTKAASGASYRAVFTNVAGKATTRAAKVSVKPIKAKVTLHPKSASKVKAGTKVKLRVKATGDFPKAKVSWEQRKPGSKKWTKVKGAATRTLTVVASHKTHGVHYRAVFSNKAGKVRSKAAKVTVRTGSPAFVSQPRHTSVRAGKTATFTASVAASPRAKLQWYSKAPGARTWVAVKGAKGTALKVRGANARTGTTYVLIATNSKGWTSSRIARLTVKR